ncbi:MAG: polysaccharide deacetylase family protein [Candidatus Omnitrophota bacterium]
MDNRDLSELAKRGHDIGSHAVSHVDLTSLDPASRRIQLKESKARLEASIHRGVDHFSYPYGHLDDDLSRSVREEGYSAACTTAPGPNDCGIGADLYRLNRIEILNGDTIEDFRKKVS